MASVDPVIMDAPLDFERLCELEPRLRDVAAAAHAITDDRELDFFCANHRWLPLAVRLRDYVGAMRRGERAGDETDVLFRYEAYLCAYLELCDLMPPCRDCGCRRFEETRRREFEEFFGQTPDAAE
jgi:hypothetical protein